MTTIVDGIIPGVLALVKKLLGGLLGTAGTKLLVSLKLGELVDAPWSQLSVALGIH